MLSEACRVTSTSPTVVIAHGAWVDATSWREVIALLQAKGVSVVAVQNPLSALADDVDAVTRAAQPSARSRRARRPWLRRHRHHAGRKSLSALPRSSTSQRSRRISASRRLMCRRTIRRCHCIGRFEVDAGGFLYLAPDAVLEFLAHDLPATEGLVLAAAQQPIRASALLDRVTEAAWRTKPSWYAVTDDDRMISPALQREIASRINASVFVLRAGHLPFLSKPKETADVILAAVDFVRGKWPSR